jgi:hypothetical protein
MTAAPARGRRTEFGLQARSRAKGSVDMKRFVWLLCITLALVACSRKHPTPTMPPSPTRLAGNPTPLVQATPIPRDSPTPRVTIVPSATRLRPTPQGETPVTVHVPFTRTNESLATRAIAPSSTPTRFIIDAGSANTPLPTATWLDSFLPSPTSFESSSETLPSETPSPSATPALSPTPTDETEDATPRPTASEDASSTPTPTFTSTPTVTLTPTPTTSPTGETWSFEKVFSYYDDEFQELYVMGEAVNNSASHLRITSFIPVLYDDDGLPITDEESFAFPPDFDFFQNVSVGPGGHLSFNFFVYLYDDIDFTIDEDHYEIQIQAESAEATREDLVVTVTDYDTSGWPAYYFAVEGVYDNPGPDLTEYVAIVVTLYGEDDDVIGVGGWFEQESSYLEAGEQSFYINVVDIWGIAYELNLEVYNYTVQLFAR